MIRSNFGHAFFGFSFLLITTLVILQLRNLHAPKSSSFSSTLGIHSIEDYEYLVDHQVFPLNKIPEEAHRSIANSLVFNQQNDLIAGSFIEAKTFLNKKERISFLSLIFGAKVSLISEHNSEQSNYKYSTDQINESSLFLVQDVNGKFQILTGV